MKNNPKILEHFHTVMSKNQTGTFVFNFQNKERWPHPLVLFYDHYEKQIYYIQGQSYDENNDLHKHLVDNKLFIKISSNGESDLIKHDTIFDCTTIYQTDLSTFIDKFQLKEKTKYQVLDTNALDKIYDTIDFNWQKKCFCFRNVKIEKNKKLKTSYDYITTNWLKEKIRFNSNIKYDSSYSNKEMLNLLEIKYDDVLVDDFQLSYGCEIIITEIGELIEEYKNKIRWSKLPKFTRTR